MLNTVNLFIALVVAAITYGTPLLFGTLGEVLTEKSGSLNLGVEGIMFMGGAIAVSYTHLDVYKRQHLMCPALLAYPIPDSADPYHRSGFFSAHYKFSQKFSSFFVLVAVNL